MDLIIGLDILEKKNNFLPLPRFEPSAVQTSSVVGIPATLLWLAESKVTEETCFFSCYNLLGTMSHRVNEGDL